MKRIIYLLLFLVATSNLLCACKPLNPPCNPYGPGEGRDPDPSQSYPVVCEDYYNRYQIADNVNVFLSDRGTLYWYNAATGLCPKICWANLILRSDGYYIRVYRMIRGEMQQIQVLDTRDHFNVTYDILLCDTHSPDDLYPRKISISRIGFGALTVKLLSPTNTSVADEVYYM